MRKCILFLLLLLSQQFVQSQPLVTRSGYIKFFSKTPLENIEAENKQVNAVLDLSKKNIAFLMLMKGFLFERALMQEHFNENYVESDKYPKASFTGSYTGDANPGKDGTYPVVVKGKLTLHGVTRAVETPASIEVKNGRLLCRSTFKIKPADYGIKVPVIVWDKVAQQLDVTVRLDYNTLK